MDHNDVNKQDFQQLIEKYLDGETTLEEVKLLVNYYESFQQSHEWVEDLGPEDTIKNRMLINILEVLQEEDVKVVPLYKRNIFKYAVAASLILFVAFNFLFNKTNRLIISPEDQPVIVNNNIKAGTDKATLTLADGTAVILEKGQNYIGANLESNGENIVYKPLNESDPEITYNYLTIPRGGQYHIKLSDGTDVWLNSETQLKYPVNFIEGETRTVELVYGEAYFDVSSSKEHKGAKFRVLNNTQEIEVLGTEFNIKAYKDEDFVYTTLIEGKVAVNNAEHMEVLTPNQQSIVNIDNNEMHVEAVTDLYSVVAWKNGVFSFKDMSLKRIMKVLSRWYDADVIFINKDVENEKFTGVLGKEQTIEEILFTIYNTNKISYEINNKAIIFR
ncbi:FecR domain-containing protein [Tamlana sp. 2201CG12-4]|uniref:FecR family protein n=1 Tax=Tamlana sp. 2201CG12-4 TaxID=3112582 RepID=UPI002DB6447F|nr:FecR domain-containing protein [Tamlana sp. 2201CG12-4]MEC3907096.1 FecR domain-containing protein [Tamlana sp. 2201CG12-4]